MYSFFPLHVFVLVFLISCRRSFSTSFGFPFLSLRCSLYISLLSFFLSVVGVCCIVVTLVSLCCAMPCRAVPCKITHNQAPTPNTCQNRTKPLTWQTTATTLERGCSTSHRDFMRCAAAVFFEYGNEMKCFSRGLDLGDLVRRWASASGLDRRVFDACMWLMRGRMFSCLVCLRFDALEL